MILSRIYPEDFDSLYDLIESSFPFEERPTRDEGRIRFGKEEFSAYALLEDGERVGFITVWQVADFHFIEHFVIYTFPSLQSGLAFPANIILSASLKALKGLPRLPFAVPRMRSGWPRTGKKQTAKGMKNNGIRADTHGSRYFVFYITFSETARSFRKRGSLHTKRHRRVRPASRSTFPKCRRRAASCTPPAASSFR